MFTFVLATYTIDLGGLWLSMHPTFSESTILIADFPMIGQAHPELSPELRSFPAGSYVLPKLDHLNGNIIDVLTEVAR